MKFISIIFFITVFISPISANAIAKRILITKTSKESNLGSIKSKLNSINIKMFVRKDNNMYFIYSNQYNNDLVLKNNFKKIKRYFQSAIIVDVAPIKSNTVQNSSQKENNTIFVNVSYGMAKISGSTNNIANSNMENNGESYSLETGYIFNENIFTSISYLNTSIDKIDTNNLYISANYQINPTENIDIYLGLLCGYSSLTLSGYAKSSASTSMLIGLQTGVKYNFNQNIALFTVYQALSVDHIINFDDATKIEIATIHNLQLGIQFSF